MDDDGLFVRLPKKVKDEDGKDKIEWKIEKVSAPFEIVGEWRDPKGDNWGKAPRFHDRDGRGHLKVIPDSSLMGEVPAATGPSALSGFHIVRAMQKYFPGYLNEDHVRQGGGNYGAVFAPLQAATFGGAAASSAGPAMVSRLM